VIKTQSGLRLQQHSVSPSRSERGIAGHPLFPFTGKMRVHVLMAFDYGNPTDQYNRLNL